MREFLFFPVRAAVLAAAVLTGAAATASAEPLSLKLWDTAPTDNWYRGAYPIGNGRLGAMIFGGTERSTLQLNEITLWTGGVYCSPKYSGGNNPGATQWLPEIRRLLFEGKVAEAQRFRSRLCGNGIGWDAYQNLGSLHIDFSGKAKTDRPQDYRRELSLADATSAVSYKNGGVTFTQTAFASHPDGVIAVRLTSSEKDALAFRVSLEPDTRRDRYNKVSKTYTVTAADNTIDVLGEVKASRMKFAADVKVVAPTADVVCNADGSVSVSNGEDVLLLFAAATNYDIREGHNIKEIADFHTPDGDYLDNRDPKGLRARSRVRKALKKAAKVPYASLVRRHTEDFRSLFDRSALNLGDAADAGKPTAELLKDYRAGRRTSRYLEVLAYEFGRYLLISSSRTAELPANLQGLWCCDNTPPWASDYHFNINLQMNYWPAFVTNIAPTADPLISLIDSLTAPGRLTARTHYGVDEGWVLNTQSTPFGLTGVGWQFEWGWTPGSGAWICNNLWDYYLFTQDRRVLERIYPLMKGCALFWQHYLQRHPKTGELVAVPSASSEHGPAGLGATYDMTLAYMHLRDTAAAADALGKDAEWAKTLRGIIREMHPIRIGASGQIKEWREEVAYNRRADGSPIGDPHHRHLSHLLGLFPGNLITAEDAKLSRAASFTLDRRGNGFPYGWSVMQRGLARARLLEADKAYVAVHGYLARNGYPNLLNSYQPRVFQIDGNFGYTATVAEMLIQSHTGTIHLLPAPAKSWTDGSFRGLCARGNFEADASWKNGTVTSVTLRSGSGLPARLRFPGMEKATVTCDGQPVAVTRTAKNLAFPTEKGKVYRISVK